MKLKVLSLLALIIFMFSGLFMSPFTFAGDDLTYQMPPKELAAIVDAPPTPSVDLGPNQQWMLILGSPNLPPIAEVAQPELRIAGIRINPTTNGPGRTRYYTSIKIKNISTENVISVQLPENPKIGNIRWSPNGKMIAFTLTKPEHIELWLAEVGTGKAEKLIDAKINDTFRSPIQWLSDNKTIICLTVPEERGELPEEATVPQGPVVQENIGKQAPARTYQDLLKNPHDQTLLDYYVTSQMLIVHLKGKVKKIGEPAIYAGIDPSPNGDYLLVEKIHRPYSYIVPIYRFPHTIDVINLDGKLLYRVADVPLAEEIPIGFNAVRTGRRSVSWRADTPATLYWVEAQDEGDPNKEAVIRDQVFMLQAPFKKQPTPLVTTGLRYSRMTWGNDNLALVSEYWWRTRRVKTWIINPEKPQAEPKLLWDYSYEDRYNDPGNPVMEQTKNGTYVLQTSDKGQSIFLIGTGASPEGNRPFLDKLDLNTLKTKRLWRSEAPYYEYPAALVNAEKQKFITRRETKTDPPNYYLRDLKADQIKQLTDFPHPTPQLKNIQKEIIRYEREDGVQLMGTLYLPEGYDPERDGRLPVFMWAYPREFKSADAAGQMRGSPYQFIRVGWSSPAIWVTQGFAVLDGPTMPIIGEGDKQPNDTYVKQLVSSANAAIDELDRRGIADPEKVAIGGHSYGAFMTANLLAHSDLFAAGIARSGAYNRTLTPFGFQAEERTFWQAPEIYFTMSPFMHADDVDEPILLIHGEADNNSGTFPIQSRRFYHGLKGLGATVRLVFLPHESHGYRARESVMHVLWEQYQWLEKYVKK